MAAAAIPLVTTAISALAGLFGNKKKQTETQQGQQSQSGTSSNYGTTSDIGRSVTTQGPQLTPAYQNFINQLVGSFSNLSQPVNLQPYAASQIQGINRASNISSRATDSIMAARGLSRSPVAATSAVNADANRIAQISGVNQQMPLLRQQLNLQNLGAAQGMASLLPSFSPTTSITDASGTRVNQGTGSTSMTGSSTGTKEGTESEGGGLGGIMQVLALLANANKGNNAEQPYGEGPLGWVANLFG